MTQSVLEKLRFRPGMATQLWRVPKDLTEIFAPALESVADPAVWRVGFTRDAKAVADAANQFASEYQSGEVIWLCYPKKMGRLPTDISRDHGWEPISQLGMLAVSQVSVDETWSALRFRFRSEITKLTRRLC